MFFRRVLFNNRILAFALFALIVRCTAPAQQPIAASQQPDSDEVIISKSDEDFRLWESRRDLDFLYGVDRRLKHLPRTILPRLRTCRSPDDVLNVVKERISKVVWS